MPAIPAKLARMRRTDRGRRWLAALPRLVEECAERWQLEIGEPFSGSQVSLVAPARFGSEDVVLKIQFPHRESDHEAEALSIWEGRGAVRLLDHDVERHALLLERCLPGTHLSRLGADASLAVLIELLPRLWVAAPDPVRSLADEAAWWARSLEERSAGAGGPFEPAVLELALDALRDLPASQGEQVLIHQDLHGDNVLAASREPWLAIDPKPISGEREFSIAPIVRSYELGHTEAAVVGRLDHLTSELGLDRDRARLWTIAQTVAWAFDGDRVLPWHVRTATWLARTP
jgi:streptomycin 6-kinase